MDELVYWLALNEKRWSLSPDKIAKAFSETNSLENLWNAPISYLQKFGFSDHSISEFYRYKQRVRLEEFSKQLHLIHQMQIRVIRYIDREYPPLLRTASTTLEEPPLLIFHKGALLNFNNCIAIIGTRMSSAYGHTIARRLGRAIASKGYTVVSGLARGIDTEAHCGALEVSKGKTIAVLAWMDPVYPPENAELLKDIEKRGAILSERLVRPDSKFGKFTPGSFVERNRVTSGISQCLIAVESDVEGGTIHQVNFALSQNRMVLALKPKRNERAIRGYKALLNMGAKSISSPKDALELIEKIKVNFTREEERLNSIVY